MRLRNKFILVIGLMVVVSYGYTFMRISSFQQELLHSLMLSQARLLADQVLLTRKWVADHKGVFVLEEEGVEPNPYLREPEVNINGRHLIKRNPAMVTRELSEYTARRDICRFRFRVTSLRPVNPANRPNEFERASLKRFATGELTEAHEITAGKDGRLLRYIEPLNIEKGCLECHARHGYRIGDIRGGLSLEIPMDWEDKAIAGNRRMLLTVFAVSILLIAVFIGLFFELLVIRRLDLLSRAMDRCPGSDKGAVELPPEKDEIGKLTTKFKELDTRLTASQIELQQTHEQMLQVEKMAAMGRLSAGIAHEINNPLGGMLNCIKGMKENPDDEEMRRRYLDLLNKGLLRIENTVRQLLNFGRREPLQLRKVPVDELIRECLTMLEYKLRNMTLITDLTLNRPLAVHVDALKQVLINLGLNAIQAMDKGGTLTVRSRETADSFIISIADTGAGIPAENMVKIFEPFFTTKEVGDGTGLGLAVTYSLVQRMGGSIEVTSVPDEGSTFSVTLPKQKEHDKPA
ncbi:MAG: ATP-binding protein [Desulfobacterales bacterium]|nr:ATP-binding protein [Desulfobacterales bacterium]